MSKKGWKELPIGGLILTPGNSEEYKTGDWRTFRPIVDKKKCINCMTCWISCPDGCILAKDKNMDGFKYSHCKGCGICSEVCPVKCISMIEETKSDKINQEKKVDEQGRYNNEK